MVCLIVLAMRVTECIIYYYFLRASTNARSAGSAVSVFIGGVLHRETSHWNHKLNDITFLDSAQGCVLTQPSLFLVRNNERVAIRIRGYPR